MKDFLERVIKGEGIAPSDVCLRSFNDNFPDAVNVEWFNKKDCYESIFYRHNLEHIAIFSLDGVLIEYRQNLTVEYLPVQIKTIAHSKGEIMNAVLKNKGNMLEYELIVRDDNLQRFLIIINDVGVVKEEKVL